LYFGIHKTTLEIKSTTHEIMESFIQGDVSYVDSEAPYFESLVHSLEPALDESLSLYAEDIEDFIADLFQTTVMISVSFTVISTIYYIAFLRVKINDLTKDMHAELRF
jgi:hypothetical protein